jgi:hypothetical protein
LANDADELSGGLLVLTVANLLNQEDFIRPRETEAQETGWTRGRPPVPADERIVALNKIL